MNARLGGARDEGRGVIGLFEYSTSVLVFDDGSAYAAPELAADAERVAAWLRAQAVEPGDRVALHMPNSLDYVRALLGCAAIGAVAVSVNTRYSPAEVDELVDRSGAELTVRGVDVAIARVQPDRKVSAAGPDAPFVVFTTSGTTSHPKMVLHRQRSIVDHAADVASAFGYSPDDVVLVAMPLCGTFGLASLMAAVAGGARVLVHDFALARAAELIAGERVSCLNGSDDMFHRLLRHGSDLSSIRLGGYARFNSSLDGIVDRADDAGATLVGLYGMSEVQALYALRSPMAETVERERAGGTLVSSAAEYRVVDGELQLRGPSLFAGYLAEGGAEIDDDLTAAHHDGAWFRTGDLASEDDERSFEYVTRMGDVLRIGGFLVSPVEIEGVVAEMSAIDAAQVVAVDRPEGARPVAFVVLADGGELDEAAVVDHCRSRLAVYKCPVRVIALSEFPSTPSANGTKIQRAKLRRLAERYL